MNRVIHLAAYLLALFCICKIAYAEDISCEFYVSLVMESEILETAQYEPGKYEIVFRQYDDDYCKANIGTLDENFLFDRENAQLLCSDGDIRAYVGGYGLSDVAEIRRYMWYEYINGFLLKLRTKDGDVYYMPIMRNGKRYGWFEDKKLYTKDEFADLCNKGWNLIINGNSLGEIKARYEMVYVPLRTTLEALGFDVGWDAENHTVEFGEYKMEMRPSGRSYSGSTNKNRGTVYTFSMSEDRFYFVDMVASCFSDFIRKELGMTVIYDYENCCVDIMPKKAE